MKAEYCVFDPCKGPILTGRRKRTSLRTRTIPIVTLLSDDVYGRRTGVARHSRTHDDIASVNITDRGGACDSSAPAAAPRTLDNRKSKRHEKSGKTIS